MEQVRSEIGEAFVTAHTEEPRLEDRCMNGMLAAPRPPPYEIDLRDAGRVEVTWLSLWQAERCIARQPFRCVVVDGSLTIDLCPAGPPWEYF